MCVCRCTSTSVHSTRKEESPRKKKLQQHILRLKARVKTLDERNTRLRRKIKNLSTKREAKKEKLKDHEILRQLGSKFFLPILYNCCVLKLMRK